MNKFYTMPLRFRVWDKVEERFLHEECYAIYSDGTIEANIRETTKDGDYVIRSINSIDFPGRFIISQDTGVKDKNGKSIYTGDIVKAAVPTEDPMGDYPKGVYATGRVEYTIASIHLVNRGRIMRGVDLYAIPTEWLEKVGNIFENPELLVEEE